MPRATLANLVAVWLILNQLFGDVAAYLVASSPAVIVVALIVAARGWNTGQR